MSKGSKGKRKDKNSGKGSTKGGAKSGVKESRKSSSKGSSSKGKAKKNNIKNDKKGSVSRLNSDKHVEGTFFGYDLQSLLTEADLHQGAATDVGLLEGCAAHLIIAGPATREDDLRRIVKGQLPEWAMKELLSKVTSPLTTPDVSRFTASEGLLLVAYQGQGGEDTAGKTSNSSDSDSRSVPKDVRGNLYRESYGSMRDLAGVALNQLRQLGPESLQIIVLGCDGEGILGALTAVDLAAYRFRSTQEEQAVPVWRPKIVLTGVTEQVAAEAGACAVATNIARHLVNLPAGDLNPVSYAEGLAELFSSADTMQVDIWDEGKIEKEGLGLLTAVGRGAEAPPRLVHLRYRPGYSEVESPSDDKSNDGSNGGSAIAPVALVGKGITFDSGGLDIKPSAGMRWMKKDMGGSAALAGLAYWLWQSNCPVPCDIYLALAENAVDERSFRPGDIITARNGLTVEIHNTDAEGRLVLADAIDVALDQPESEKPVALIDFATLTGAMRVGLGLKIAGLVSDDDELAQRLEASAKVRSDYLWRMPLFHDYNTLLNSDVAALSNAASGRFGGGITAALFLKQFVQGVPWAHVDMHAWTDSPSGALGEPGGNGQGVQLLIELLSHWPRAGRTPFDDAILER